MPFVTLLAGLMLSAVTMLASQITYSDSTLLISNYTILQGTSGNASLTFSNPAGAFSASRTLGSGGGFAGFAAINGSFVYNPSVGVLSSIDVSALLTSDTNLWALYISQGSNLYRASISNTPGSTPQLSSATGIVATSFALVNLGDGTLSAGTPDFGAAFTLGFGQRFSSAGAVTNNVITFDDLSITLNVTPSTNPVPEPSSGLLLGVALSLGASCASRFRRR